MKKCNVILVFIAVLLTSFVSAQTNFEPVMELQGDVYKVTESSSSIHGVGTVSGNPVNDFHHLSDIAVTFDSTAVDATNANSFRGYVSYIVDTENKAVKIYFTNAKTTAVLQSTANETGDSLDFSIKGAQTNIYYKNRALIDTNWTIIPNSQKLWVNDELWTEIADTTYSGFYTQKVYFCDDDSNKVVIGSNLYDHSTDSANVKLQLKLVPVKAGATPNDDVDDGFGAAYLNKIVYDTGIPANPPWDTEVAFIAVDALTNFNTKEDSVYVLGIQANGGKIVRYAHDKATLTITANRYKDEYGDKLYEPKDIAVVSRPTQFQTTPDTINYIFVTDIRDDGVGRLKVINADSMSYDPSVSSNILQTETFASVGPGHEVTIDAAPITEDLIEVVEVATGEVWTQVEDLSLVDTLKAYEFDRLTGLVVFGDGTNGQIPPDGDFTFAYARSSDVYVLDETYGENPDESGSKLYNPKGVAARYNAVTNKIDIYVIDGNVVKKYEFDDHDGTATPDETGQNYEMVYKGNITGSTDYPLVDPFDIEVIKIPPDDYTVSAINDEVQLYISDSDVSANRVLTAVDAQAMNPASTTLPTFNTEIISSGTEFGQTYEPLGIGLVHGAFVDTASVTRVLGYPDVYVVNQNREIITKYSKSYNRQPTITFVDPYDYGHTPDLLVTNGQTLDIQMQGSDENIANCSVKLWYAIGDSASTLIESGISPTSSNITYSWTVPEDVPFTDSTRFTFWAQISDEQGLKSSVVKSRWLMVLQDLKPMFTLEDNFDGDQHVWLQNGGTQYFNLVLNYFTDVTGIKAIVEVDENFINSEDDLDVFQGNIWSGNEQGNVIWLPEIDGNKIKINTSIVGIPNGVDGASKVVARIKIKAKSDLVSSSASGAASDRFIFGKVHVDTTDNQSIITLADGSDLTYGSSQYLVEDLNLVGSFLADCATIGIGADTTTSLPNLAPYPDGIIEFQDLMVFSLGWTGVDGESDLIADLGSPTTNLDNAPNVIPDRDKLINSYDMAAFTTMWSWYRNTFSTKSQGLFAGKESFNDNPKSISLSFSDIPEENQYVDLIVNANNIADLKGANLKLRLPENKYEIVRVDRGEFFNTAIFIPEVNNNEIEISTARVSKWIPTVSGSGEIAVIKLRVLEENEEDILLQYDLRDGLNKPIEKGSSSVTMGDALNNLIPQAMVLSQNYPNPFNPTTTIDYGLAVDSKAVIKIYNISGQLIKTFDLGFKEKGYYQVMWNGTNNEGNNVASGMYFYRLQTEDGSLVNKMLLLK